MNEHSSTYSVNAGQSSSVSAIRDDGGRQRFLLALLLSTWLPLLFFISVAHLETSYLSIKGMKSIFLFLGTAHVPATFFFYGDKSFSHIIRTHKARYIYLPALLTIGAGLLVAFSNLSTQVYLFLVFWGWQAFHYGRQNLGIYSFTSIAEGMGSADKLEKLAIDLATWCGILGTFRVLGLGIAPEYLRGTINGLYKFGMFSYLAVIVFSLYIYIKNYYRTTTLKTIFFWTLVVFFVPVYLSNDINVTFLSYAIAHGLQYIIFMGIVSYSGDRGERTRAVQYQNVLKLTGLIILLGFLFFHADTMRSLEFIKSNTLLVRSFNFLFGAVLGATMAHFVIDAGAWRLSKTPQREYMTRRFGFVFAARNLANSK